MSEVLFNQLNQNPIPTVLRLQNLGLNYLPEIPESELWRCKHILAINLSGNNFPDKMEVLRWLLPFKRVEVIILGWDDITDEHISILSQLINLRILDDLQMEDELSVSEELKKEQYQHLMDPWVFQKLPTNQLTFYNQSADEFSKYLQYEVNDEIQLDMENMPYSIRYIVLNNINMQTLLPARRNNQIIYLDIRKNQNLKTDNFIETIASYDSLQTLFIDDSVIQQLEIQNILNVCKHIVQINNQYFGDNNQNKEIIDFSTIVGINYYDYLKDENLLQTLDTQENEFVLKPEIIPSKSSQSAQQSSLHLEHQVQQVYTDSPVQNISEVQQIQNQISQLDQEQKEQYIPTLQENEIDSDGELVDLDNSGNQVAGKIEHQNNIIIDLSNLNLTDDQLIQYLLSDKRIQECIQAKQNIILNLQGNNKLTLNGLEQLDSNIKQQIIKLNLLNTSIIQNDQQVNRLISIFPDLLDLQINYDLQDFNSLAENILNNSLSVQNINNYKLVDASQCKPIDEDGKIMFADSQILRELAQQHEEHIQANEHQATDNQQSIRSSIENYNIQSQQDIAQQHDVDMLLQQVQLEEQNNKSLSEYDSPDKRNSLHADYYKSQQETQSNDLNKTQSQVSDQQNNSQLQKTGVSQALNISLTGSFENFVEATPMQQYVYKSLYMKQNENDVEDVPKHEFVNYFVPQLSAVKQAINNVMDDFRKTITNSIHQMRKVKIPHLNQLIGQYESTLQSKDLSQIIPKKVFKQLQIPQSIQNVAESEVDAIAFERISPQNKLMKVMQKIYQCQNQYLESSQRVKELYKQTLQKQAQVENNDKIKQMFSETYILQNSLQQLSTYNPVLIKHQNEQKQIFINAMGKFKLLQQQLLVIKNQENITLQKIEINRTRSIQTNFLVPDHMFNPNSNLLNAQQIIKLFRNAINQFQQKNQDPQTTSTGDFGDFFNNQFFSLHYGTKIAKQKQNMFYNSIKNNIDHFHVAAIWKCLNENKINQYEQALIQLESIQFDLLKGAVYSVDSDQRITEANASQKVNQFITGYIERKYWEDVLNSINPELITKLEDRDKVTWDLLKGLLMLYVLDQQERNQTKSATIHSLNYEHDDSVMDPDK